MTFRRAVLNDVGAVLGYYPWPLSVLHSSKVGDVYELLAMFGFWDMEEGGYYVTGRFNWRFWRHPWARRHPDWAADVRARDPWPFAFHRALIRSPVRSWRSYFRIFQRAQYCR